MTPQCLYPVCRGDAHVHKPGRLLPVNFLCSFHQLDEFAVKFVLNSQKFKAMMEDWGFVIPTASESGSEGSEFSAHV